MGIHLGPTEHLDQPETLRGIGRRRKLTAHTFKSFMESQKEQLQRTMLEAYHRGFEDASRQRSVQGGE